MPNLQALVKSNPSAEEISGAILEEMVNSRQYKTSPRNLAVAVSGQGAGEGDPSTVIILEGFQWLQSNGMIARTIDTGEWYFVTRKGKEIGNAGNLRVHLEKQQVSAIAAQESASKEIAAIKKNAETEIKQAIEDAKKEAGSILDLARETAQGISLNDVQKQFGDAAKQGLRWGIPIWGLLSATSIAAFIVVVVFFFSRWQPSFAVTLAPDDKSSAYGYVIYQTVLRVTLLTAMAAVATFCLKVLRAQLHLREQNLHRQRVANSMAAFIAATKSPEQRDLIVGRLADAIAAFGNSGLLADDDSMSPMKVILESVQRLKGPSSE